MHGSRFGASRNPPKSGEHTREILEEIGFDEQEVEALIAEEIAATVES